MVNGAEVSATNGFAAYSNTGHLVICCVLNEGLVRIVRTVWCIGIPRQRRDFIVVVESTTPTFTVPVQPAVRRSTM